MKAALFSLLLALPVPAAAQTLDDIVQLDVLPGWRGDDGRHMAALRLTLAPGWKTYWRSPGDGGIPPQITLSGDSDVAVLAMHWPVPDVFEQNGLRSIGYADSVTLPIEVQTTQSGNAVLSGALEIGVCEDICVPVTFNFRAELPPRAERDTAILAALIDRPMTGREAGAGAATCQVDPSPDGLVLTAVVDLPATGGTEAVVIETGDPSVWVSEPDTDRTGNRLQAMVDMVHVTGQPFALDRSTVRITVLGRDRAVELRGCEAG